MGCECGRHNYGHPSTTVTNESIDGALLLEGPALEAREALVLVMPSADRAS
jgi:hypothetical protein